jgi:AraC family transcriptional regulator
MSEALRIINGVFGRVALLDMDRSLVWHAHPHCHVLLKIEGDDTQFTVGDRVAPLTDRLAVLVNAWEPHAYVHDPTRRTALILALYIEPGWLRSFRSNWAASGAPGFFAHTTGEASPRIAKLAKAFAAEMVHAPESSAFQQELLSALMIAVIEQFTPWKTVGDSLRDHLRLFASDRRVRRAIELMRADPAGFPGVDDLAKAVGLSRAHFFRLFEQSTGVTPHVFLNSVRIERAVQVIASGDDRLADIGSSLGFESPAHFSRFFRDHVSIGPRAFRRAVQDCI